MSSFDYYTDESRHGEYQYVTIEQIVNDFMMSMNDDDYHSNTPRHKVIYQAKRGLRELYFDVLREIKAIKLDLSPKLNIVVPPDYINYVRISWVDDAGRLRPMVMNNKLSMAEVYLQDHRYNLLFDHKGCVLKANDSGFQTHKISENAVEATSYDFCDSSFQPNRDGSKSYTNGQFNINKNSGVIQFGSEVQGKTIVLEYLSDGLASGCEGVDESEIRIHKFADSTLRSFIYHELIQARRNVPYNEKLRARREFYNNKRVTKRRMTGLKKEDFMQIFKGSNSWINK